MHSGAYIGRTLNYVVVSYLHKCSVYLFSLNNKKQNNFHLFLCFWCDQPLWNTHKEISEILRVSETLSHYCGHGPSCALAQGVPFKQLAACDAIHESLGFSPAQLVFSATETGKILAREFPVVQSFSKEKCIGLRSHFRECLHCGCYCSPDPPSPLGLLAHTKFSNPLVTWTILLTLLTESRNPMFAMWTFLKLTTLGISPRTQALIVTATSNLIPSTSSEWQDTTTSLLL